MMEIAGPRRSGSTGVGAIHNVLSGKDHQMQPSSTTYSTLMSPLSVRPINGLAAAIMAIILLGSNALSQSDPVKPGMSAVELARKVVTNELKVQGEEHGHWMYRLDKEESGRKQTLEIVETNSGSLSQRLSTDGLPLDAKQQRNENQRMQRLVSHPDEQWKLQRASNKKAEQGARLFKILPDVFVFSYAGRQGDLVTLNFRPNPNFQPSSLEAWVFHGMEGEMTVDIKQERLVALNGHLMEDMKFGVGVLGHLEKGGKFEVRQTEVAPGHWEMTELNVNMKGRALLFKTIGVQVIENHTDFHRVPNDLTLAQGADLLNRQIVVADNR